MCCRGDLSAMTAPLRGSVNRLPGSTVRLARVRTRTCARSPDQRHGGQFLRAQARSARGGWTGLGRGASDAGHVGGEEVHAVAVEVSSCSVVVLGGARVGVPG